MRVRVIREGLKLLENKLAKATRDLKEKGYSWLRSDVKELKSQIKNRKVDLREALKRGSTRKRTLKKSRSIVARTVAGGGYKTRGPAGGGRSVTTRNSSRATQSRIQAERLARKKREKAAKAKRAALWRTKAQNRARLKDTIYEDFFIGAHDSGYLAATREIGDAYQVSGIAKEGLEQMDLDDSFDAVRKLYGRKAEKNLRSVLGKEGRHVKGHMPGHQSYMRESYGTMASFDAGFYDIMREKVNEPGFGQLLQNRKELAKIARRGRRLAYQLVGDAKETIKEMWDEHPDGW